MLEATISYRMLYSDGMAHSMNSACLSKAPEALLALVNRGCWTSVLTEVEFAALDLLVFQFSETLFAVWIVRVWYLDWKTWVRIVKMCLYVTARNLLELEA